MMTNTHTETAPSPLQVALRSPEASARLQAALTAGTHPAPEHVLALVAQCRTEPEFYVREMLTWALTRHDHDTVLDLLLVELTCDAAKARSQALHTLSKLGDTRAWPAITVALLTDDDDEVARAAWRTAAGLASEGQKGPLARTLATQFGRGEHELQRSLSRAFTTLGASALPAADAASTSADRDVRTHALATAYLLNDLHDSFESAMAQARTFVARQAAPTLRNDPC
ncbi:MAG: HEAT repeat domain-containing protein [Nannocystales bacterium]